MKLCIIILLSAAGLVSPPTFGATQLESLTLDQALEMAESLQPELAEAKAMVEAAEGRARQAGTFPNPEAIVGAQQIPFSGNAPNEKEYVAGI
jgi:outer membrane protein TolC